MTDQVKETPKELVPTQIVVSEGGPREEKKPLEEGGSENSIDIEACCLFIGDLARNVSEDQLRTTFQQCGEVVTVDIKRDKLTANNLGYGFVQYKTREEAAAAKSQLNGIEIGNRKIRIGWAQKNTSLFIGDLDNSVTTAQLRELFKKYGPIIEEDTYVKAGSGRYLSQGFVRFQHRPDAEKAKAELNRKMIGSSVVRIGWGDNSVQKHCVHVQFNPTQGANLTEQDFRTHFEKFGPVISVSLPRFVNKRLKGYGFVHFDDSSLGEKAANAAIAQLGDSQIGQVPIRCSSGKRQGQTRYYQRMGLATYSSPLTGFRGGFRQPPLFQQPWMAMQQAQMGWQNQMINQQYSQQQQQQQYGQQGQQQQGGMAVMSSSVARLSQQLGGSGGGQQQSVFYSGGQQDNLGFQSQYYQQPVYFATQTSYDYSSFPATSDVTLSPSPSATSLYALAAQAGSNRNSPPSTPRQVYISPLNMTTTLHRQQQNGNPYSPPTQHHQLSQQQMQAQPKKGQQNGPVLVYTSTEPLLALQQTQTVQPTAVRTAQLSIASVPVKQAGKAF